MTIYAGTVLDGATWRHIYAERRADLPKGARWRRTYLYPDAGIAWETLWPAIQETEAFGVRVSWHVGSRWYDTQEDRS